MNHILVVDDEPLMRTWLSKSIPKHSTCFDVPNTAQDGIEAIEYLKQAAYDVVITDIKMPGMDGLSLAKFIQENYPDTVVIIISGFNDFAYARKAIQYGVKDYLLKPLVDDDLIKLLNDINKRLQKHTPTLLANPTEEERANPRAMLFRAILEDDSDGIYQGYKVFSSTDTDPMLPYACVIQAALLPIARDNAVLPTEAHSRNYRQNLAAVSLCKKYNWTPFFGNNGDTYIVAEGETKATLIANLHEFQSNFSASFRFAQDANLFAGRIVDDSMDLSYSLASIAGLRSLPLFTSNELYSYALLNEYQQQLIEFEKANKKVLSDFTASQETTLRTDIDQLCSLVPHKNSAALWEMGCYMIQSITDCFLIEDTLLTSAWKELTDFCTSCAGGVSDANFSHAVYQSVFCLLGKEQTITQDTMPVIKMAKEYINQHFCESISLSEVADYCNVNSSYLSNLFHKQLGISYSKYLMQIRMERAAAYLKDSPETKIYEIGEKLGFVSQNILFPFSKNTMVYRQPPIRKNNVKASRGWSQRHRSTKYHRDLLRTRGKAGPKPRFPLFEFFNYAKKRNHKVLVQVLIKFSVDVAVLFDGWLASLVQFHHCLRIIMLG